MASNACFGNTPRFNAHILKLDLFHSCHRLFYSPVMILIKVPVKWNFSPLFYSRILKSTCMLHWFIIFEFKLCSGPQNNFSIPPKLAKKCNFRFRTSDVIRCVSFDCFTLRQCISYKVSTHWAVFSAVLFSGKCPQMMNYPVTHHLRVMLSRCN